MNILYCGDENIKDGLIISILSLLKNVQDTLKIYVLTLNTKIEGKEIKGIPLSTIDNINRVIKEKNVNNFIKLMDITDLFSKNIPEVNLDTRFTPCCMLRLYADQIDELPDKILYLDSDVVCRKKEIDVLYNQNMEEFEIAGVLDYYGKWFFKNTLFKFDYMNSGVLLLNLKKIKETRIIRKV